MIDISAAVQQRQNGLELDKRFKHATLEARRLWPGPVGEHLSRDIDSARSLSFLVRSPYWRALVDDVLERTERGER